MLVLKRFKSNQLWFFFLCLHTYQLFKNKNGLAVSEVKSFLMRLFAISYSIPSQKSCKFSLFLNFYCQFLVDAPQDFRNSEKGVNTKLLKNCPFFFFSCGEIFSRSILVLILLNLFPVLLTLQLIWAAEHTLTEIPSLY